MSCVWHTENFVREPLLRRILRKCLISHGSSDQTCLNPTRIWEIYSVGDAPSRNYVITHLWWLIRHFVVMWMNFLYKNVWQVKLYDITSPWATQCIAWHRIWTFICPYLKVNTIFCSIVEPQKSHVCTWVTVYRITLKSNLWKDTQYLMFQCHNEINYWHII